MSTLLDDFRRLVTAFVGRRMDHLALYPCRVVQQRADGTLDLEPESSTVPSCQGVPIRHGLPGVTVEVAAGERVLLGYEGGDPSRPFAALWTAGSVTKITINGGNLRVAREGDDVVATADFVTWCASVVAKVNTLPGAPTTTAPAVVATVNEGYGGLRVP